MKTDDLIRTLGADAARPQTRLATVWSVTLLAAVMVAAAMFLALLGPRPDIAEAAGTPRFLFKFVAMLVLAGGAFALFDALARPGARRRSALGLAALAPALLVAAVMLELLVVPEGEWRTRWIGTNIEVCLTFIPLIGLGPLALLLVALRRAAPTRPVLAGAVAGVLAGALAAAFYAAHCPDDSPLFVATWYTLAVAILALAGAALGRVFIRW